jgi:RNA polymerase sigma-70 factor, ECF subfamily
VGSLPQNSEDLLRQAAEGGPAAQSELLERYRERLRNMVAMRLDRRMAARVDPSDIVQEALQNAHQRLQGYFDDPPASFYLWLRGIAWDRLVDAYRVHVATDKRTVLNEQPWLWLNDESIGNLAHSIAAGSGYCPQRQAMLLEMNQRVRAALLELSPVDREVLTLRYLEHLSVQEIAEVLAITSTAVTARHLRALKRLRKHLGPSFSL